MRIITGTAKGSKLKTPKGMATRPTADRVKESVFNIIGSMVEERMVLDLFAGTGNLGLEALSRGAQHAVFVDQSIESVNIIKANAIHTKLLDKVEIYKNDVIKVIGNLNRTGRNFNLVFCDPPYNKGLVSATLNSIDQSTVMQNNGLIVFEHSRHEEVVDCYQALQIKRTEQYGETIVTFLTYSAQQ